MNIINRLLKIQNIAKRMKIWNLKRWTSRVSCNSMVYRVISAVYLDRMGLLDIPDRMRYIG